MPKLHAEVRTDLCWMDDATLAEITADGHTFASREWYRFTDPLDLSQIAGGAIRSAYVVVFLDDRPICICPVHRLSGRGIYFAYSIRRYYFEHWIDEVVRSHAYLEQRFARMLRWLDLYRRMLDWSHTSLDDCLLVGSPLAIRSQIPVAPSTGVGRDAVYGTLLAFLQRMSRRARLPLWFHSISGEGGRLSAVLREGGCQPTFLFHDNVIDLDGYRSFGDYLQSFRRPVRKALCREMQRVERAGVEFDVSSDVSEYAEEISDLSVRCAQRSGNRSLCQPVEFWQSLGRSFGSGAEVILASRGEQPLGAHVVLRNERRGEMWTYRMSRSDQGASAVRWVGSSLGMYEPIRRAISLGYRRLWLGPTAYEGKSLRGARQVPLYSYFWFPRRWDRWVLLPYLVQFGQVAHARIAQSLARPGRIRAAMGSAVQTEAH